MNHRSVRTTGSQTAKGLFEEGYKILMKREKGKADYEAAIRLFDKAQNLGYRDPLCVESKISACFRLSLHEEAEHRREKRRRVPGTVQTPDGSALFSNAVQGAQAAIKRTGAKRWQPHYLLAECYLHKEQFADAQRAINDCQQTASYLSAKPAIVDKVRGLAERIWKDAKFSATRKAGRAEAVAISRHLHAIAEQKKLTDFTPMVQDDIWILIAQYAAGMDPNAPRCMSHVNRRLRGVMVNTPILWNRLSIGVHKKTDAKVDRYLERCGGADRPGFLSVTLKQGCDRLEAFPSIQDKLRDELGNVREFDAELETLDHRFTTWRHKLTRVADLRIASAQHSISSDLTFGLVPPTSSSLKHLTLGNVTLQPSVDLLNQYQADRTAKRLVPPLCIPDAAVQLANLRTFSVRGGQLGQALEEYLHAMPKLEVLRLQQLYTAPALVPVAQPVLLEELHTVELSHHQPQGNAFFHDIYAPNLRTLEFASAANYNHFMAINPQPTLTLVGQLRARGLAAALPGLTSLELYQSTISTAELLPILEDLSSLRYLGLAKTVVTNDLVRALVNGKKDAHGKRQEFVPNLEALSIAAMSDLNAADLRDLVCARKGLPLRDGKLVDGSYPPGLAPPNGPPAASRKGVRRVDTQVPKKQKMFGAVRAPGKTTSQPASLLSGPEGRATSLSARPSQSARPSDASQQPIAGSSTPTVSASAPPVFISTQAALALEKPKCTPLRWLNLDHCFTLDYNIVDWLRTQIGYVSADMGHVQGVQDRMMGKNQYSWDMDRSLCEHRNSIEGEPKLGEEGYVGPCVAVEDKVTGKWSIKHTCGVYTTSGPGYVARSSQAEPTESQMASQEARERKDKGKGKATTIIRPGGWQWGSSLPSKRRGSNDSSASSSNGKRSRDE